ADRRVDLREILGGRQRRATRGTGGADRHDPGHTGIRRTGHKLGVRRLAHVQMRVAVDHRFGNSGSSDSTGTPLPRSANSARSYVTCGAPSARSSFSTVAGMYGQSSTLTARNPSPNE